MNDALDERAERIDRLEELIRRAYDVIARNETDGAVWAQLLADFAEVQATPAASDKPE